MTLATVKRARKFKKVNHKTRSPFQENTPPTAYDNRRVVGVGQALQLGRGDVSGACRSVDQYLEVAPAFDGFATAGMVPVRQSA